MTFFRRCRAPACAMLALTALPVTNAALADGIHEIGEPGAKSAVSRLYQIVLHDNYFEPETIMVQAGETVRFVISNEGDFLHEFNIGTAAMHERHQAEMLTMFEHGMIEADKINHEMMDMAMGSGSKAHDDPNSVLLEPGQTAEIVWTFPEEGELEFACNVPGHYQVGMVGDVDIRG